MMSNINEKLNEFYSQINGAYGNRFPNESATYLNPQNSGFLSQQNSSYLTSRNNNYLSSKSNSYLSNQNSSYLQLQNSNYLSIQNSNYLSSQNSNYLSSQNSNYLSSQNETYTVLPAKKMRIDDGVLRPSFLQDSIERARQLAKASSSQSAIINMYGQFCPINGFKIDDVYPVSDGKVHKISEPVFSDIDAYPTPCPPSIEPGSSKNIHNFKSGYGAKLLSRMGWQQGDCLGVDKSRVAEELEIKRKNDRKGLAAQQEKVGKKVYVKAKNDSIEKNPVSILMEYCQKNKLPAPVYREVESRGPSNMMEFRMSVTLADHIFTAPPFYKSKKEARAGSALMAVQLLDI